ncbi:MAG: TolC family outer membrane protein [Methyloprofundus sp.]|nr:TolC family outer membrane protein [Methyloprofundus sp.]
MKLKILLFVATSIHSLYTPSLSAQTMQEAVQQTINENPEIQSARSERSAVTYEIDQARAGYLPKVDIAAGIGWNTEIQADKNYGEEASVRLTQMVFDGLATPSEVSRQTSRSDSRSYSVLRQAEISALQAIEAYLGMIRTEELLGLAKENLAIHTRTYDQIQLRARQGVARRAEADQAYGRLALAEKNLLSEIGNIRDAESSFQRIVGTLPRNLKAPQAPSEELPKNIDDAIKLAVKHHPALKSANADIAAAFSQHDTAKASYMPRVDIEAGAVHETARDDTYAMLRLRYNIFNGGRDLARRKETSEQINQAKEVRDNTFRQVTESMRISWTAYQTIKRQLVFFKKHRDASILSNAAYQKQFNIGQRTLLDLLDSANEMFSTKSAYSNAKYDTLYAQYRILASKGRLTRYLGITLPKEAMTLMEAEKSEDKDTLQAGVLTPLTHGTVDDGEIKPYTSLCYKLKSDDDFKDVQRLAEIEFYKLSLVNQPISYTSSYLLLAPPSKSMRESFKLEQKLKSQGYSELWLFRSGEFRGRISLGLFSIKENASKAQKEISKKVQLALEVTPRYKTKQNLVVHIQLINSEIEKFEEKFAKYIDKNSTCSPEAVTDSEGYNAIQY